MFFKSISLISESVQSFNQSNPGEDNLHTSNLAFPKLCFHWLLFSQFKGQQGQIEGKGDNLKLLDMCFTIS